MVDISGLDKATVIQALYDKARPLGMGFLQYKPGPLPREEAEKLVDHYIDYLHGRVMKLIITPQGNSFDETLFDRNNGSGAAQSAIDAILAA